MAGEFKQMVVFALDKGEFGFPVAKVQEIVRPGTFTKVPLTPPYILGLSNLRGQILPVIDLRQRLGLPSKERDDRTRLLVVDLRSALIGFLVDEVKEVRCLKEEELEPPPEETSGFENLVEAVVKIDGGERMVFLLSPEKIVGEGSLVAEEDRRSATFRRSQTPKEKEKETSSSLRRFLSFWMGQEEYAFPIETVQEIIRHRPLKEIPEVPSFVKGLLPLRNHVLPVLDLRSLLGLEPRIVEVQRKLNHLQKIMDNLLRQARENGEKDLDPKRNILTFWIKERLENSRSEQEFFLLTRLDKAYESFLDFYQKGDFETLEELAEEIFALFEDLTKILPETLQEEQRILVLEVGGRRVGLLVDRVEEVLAVSEEHIDVPPSDDVDIAAVIRLNQGKRLIFVLDEGVVPAETVEELSEGGEEMEPTKTIEESEELQLVTFNLGEEEYGIPIIQIQEINRLGRITPVPNTPDFIEGVTNLRGEVIPVVDLRKRFGLEPREKDDRTRLVIVQLEGKKVGLIVDWVNEVARLSKSDVEPPPQMLKAQVDLRFISGIAKVGKDRMIIVLDVEETFSPEEKEALELAGQEKEDDKTKEAQFIIAE